MYRWTTFFKIFAILILLTIPFWVWKLDYLIESSFYDPTKGGWYLQKAPFWDFMYRFGVFPGLLAALGSLFALSMSYWRPQWLQWRKPALFMILTLALGPGFLVNAVLKENYGRPRPAETTILGGTEEYLNVLVPGSSGGKSFPCGHCSIGIYLAVPFLFLRKKQKKLAYAFLLGGTAFGLILGWARMIAGGHFPSDVLWSVGLVWLTALAVANWIRLDEPIRKTASKKQARRATILVGIFLPVVTLGLLIATPYVSDKSLTLSQETVKELNTVTVSLDHAIVKIKEGNELEIHYRASGFGFPNSRVNPSWDAQTGTFQLKNAGIFTELKIDVTLMVPAHPSVVLKMNEGKVLIEEEGLIKGEFGERVKVQFIRQTETSGI